MSEARREVTETVPETELRFDIVGQCIDECIESIISAERDALNRLKAPIEIADTDVPEIVKTCRQLCIEYMKKKGLI